MDSHLHADSSASTHKYGFANCDADSERDSDCITGFDSNSAICESDSAASCDRSIDVYVPANCFASSFHYKHSRALFNTIENIYSNH